MKTRSLLFECGACGRRFAVHSAAATKFVEAECPSCNRWVASNLPLVAETLPVQTAAPDIRPKSKSGRYSAQVDVYPIKSGGRRGSLR